MSPFVNTKYKWHNVINNFILIKVLWNIGYLMSSNIYVNAWIFGVNIGGLVYIPGLMFTSFLLDILHYTFQSQYFKTSHVWNHIPFSCGLVLDYFRGRYLNTRVYVSMTKLNYKDQTKY